MALSRDEVLHIAALCRIGMTDGDVEAFRAQLSDILGHFEALGEVDVADVPPTGHLGAIQTVTREDEAAPSLDRDDVLLNAPLREDAYFRVRVVLED